MKWGEGVLIRSCIQTCNPIQFSVTPFSCTFYFHFHFDTSIIQKLDTPTTKTLSYQKYILKTATSYLILFHQSQVIFIAASANLTLSIVWHLITLTRKFSPFEPAA